MESIIMKRKSDDASPTIPGQTEFLAASKDWSGRYGHGTLLQSAICGIA